jgi:hypothetical protein
MKKLLMLFLVCSLFPVVAFSADPEGFVYYIAFEGLDGTPVIFVNDYPNMPDYYSGNKNIKIVKGNFKARVKTEWPNMGGVILIQLFHPGDYEWLWVVPLGRITDMKVNGLLE